MRPAQPTPDTQAEPSSGTEGDRAGDPALTKRLAREQFEKWSRDYDRSWLNEIVFFPSIRACQEEIGRWQVDRGARPYRMLDVGCGTGSLLTTMSQDPCAELLVGLDYSPAMVGAALVKFAGADGAGKLHALVADAERLPFADGSFDVVTCCNSFHHYPRQAITVRAFRRVLRPGGLLIVIDGFRDNVIGWVVYDVFVAAVERRVHHASWSELRRMLLEAGFADVRQRKLNVLAPLLVSVGSVR